MAILGGCSTTPALTTAVVDAYEQEFTTLDKVEIALSPGNKLPRGIGTIASVVSYCGKPFKMPVNGVAETIIGWTGIKRHTFPGIGNRFVSYCNVPDLTMLPIRYPSLGNATSSTGITSTGVEFRAGLELSILQWAMYAGAVLLPHIKYEEYAQYILDASLLVSKLGSDDGAMNMVLTGTGTDGAPHQVSWSMFAGDGHGTASLSPDTLT